MINGHFLKLDLSSFLFVTKNKRSKEKVFSGGNSLRLRLRSGSPPLIWNIVYAVGCFDYYLCKVLKINTF